jgi:hypothetical protein
VSGFVDNAHAALTENGKDFVVAGERRANQGILQNVDEQSAVMRARRDYASELTMAFKANLPVQYVLLIFNHR